MRELTATLAAAQCAASRVPFVQVIAGRRRTGWQRLYTGDEAVYFHGAAVAGDGSVVRARVGTSDDNYTLYRQRVVDPGPGAFGLWISTGEYDCRAVAVAARESLVHIFWTTLDRSVKYMSSNDYGINWSNPVVLDYIPAAPVTGIAAAFKPNGDLGLFFTGGDILYTKQRIGSVWQEKVGWDKSTGELDSVSVVYDRDWLLIAAGEDFDGNPRVWTLLLGDGGEIPSGQWGILRELVAGVAGGNCRYAAVSLDKPDVYRVFFVEKITGINPGSRVYRSDSVGAVFSDNLWGEPSPFEYESEYGLVAVKWGPTTWLSAPDGVWEGSPAEETLELTADIAGLQAEITISGGHFTVEIDNSGGKYDAVSSVLDNGAEIEFNPGYRTPDGDEVSPGLVFRLTGREQIHGGGRTTLVLTGGDGWQSLEDWRPRYEFRWNATAPVTSVKDILRFVLARAGLNLLTISGSEVINTFCPDFTIHRGDNGRAIVTDLLSFVPDVLFIEGTTVRLLHPQPGDTPAYVYGTEHVIYQGNYFTRSWAVNHVETVGHSPVSGEDIVVEAFNWEELEKSGEKLSFVSDSNLHTLAETNSRGLDILRKTGMQAAGGKILVPVNCAQQLYDVIGINSASAPSGGKMRVTGISLRYRPEKGIYTQLLILGGV